MQTSQALIQVQSSERRHNPKLFSQLGEESLKAGNQHIINPTNTMNDETEVNTGTLVEDDEKTYLENVKKVVEMAHDELINDPFNAEVDIDGTAGLELDSPEKPQTIQPQMSETPVQYKKVTEKRYTNPSL